MLSRILITLPVLLLLAAPLSAPADMGRVSKPDSQQEITTTGAGSGQMGQVVGQR